MGFIKLFLCLFIPQLINEMIFKIYLGINLDFSYIRILLFTIEISLLLGFILSFFKEKTSKIIIVSLLLIESIYMFIQMSFKSFMGNFMSFGMLKNGDVGRVKDAVGTFIRSINILYIFTFIPLILVIVLFINKKINYNKLNKKGFLIVGSSLLMTAILSYSSLYISSETQLKSNLELYKKPTLIDIALNQFGVNRFALIDLNNFIYEKKELVNVDPMVDTKDDVVDEDYKRNIDDTNWKELIEKEDDKYIKNIHEYFINQSITDKNEYTGMFKDKNLILIMTESFDMSIIDEKITPNLYKIVNSGWYFDNYYAPKYSCTTGESEFAALTSIIPSINLCTPHSYKDNTYTQSLFNLFNNSNYISTSYHGWDDTFYPRKILHKSMGSTFYNALDFGFDVENWWTSDHLFMQKAYDVFKDYDRYFSFVISLNMHFSYDFDTPNTKRNWDLVKDLNTDITMKRYLAKASEYDKGLGYLLDSLEKDNKLEDTVIIIFGDHYPYNLDLKYLNDFSSINRYEDLNEDILPFIIYNPSLEHKVISKTMSTFDILPTIANLFDLEYDPRYYVGKDIFSNEEAIVIFPNGNWVTDKAIYFSKSDEYKAKDDINIEYIKDINSKVLDKFKVSDLVLKKDYFKYIK